MTSAELAAWVQSVGSVIAILVSVWIARAADKRAAAAEQAAAEREAVAARKAEERSAQLAIEAAEDRAARERRDSEDRNGIVQGAILAADLVYRRVEEHRRNYFDAMHGVVVLVYAPGEVTIAPEGVLDIYLARAPGGPITAALYILQEALMPVYFSGQDNDPETRYNIMGERAERIAEVRGLLQRMMTPLEQLPGSA